MSVIRAFVGHSFEKDDEVLVGEILEHLNRISKLNSNFTWEHAALAQPVEVADKILSMLNDKNVFIGICSKRERAIKASALRKSRIKRAVLVAQEDSFEWKTSDWIIQEIGLAVGRGLKLI